MKKLQTFRTLAKTMCIIALATLLNCTPGDSDSTFQSNWPAAVERTWIGPEYWTNPLQDWQLHDGRIECITSGGDRNVFLLTHELSENSESVQMSVRLGRLENDTDALDEGWVGFKVGVRGEFSDYRDNAVRGIGLPMGMTTRGELFIGGLNGSEPLIQSPFDDIRLEFITEAVGEKVDMILSAFNKEGGLITSVQREQVDLDWLRGGVALVCSHGEVQDMPAERPAIDDGNWGFRPGTQRGGNVRFWFADWKLSGGKTEAHPERLYGPVLFVQYTLSNGVMKMTAQLAPIGRNDGQTVGLSIRKGKVKWQDVAEAEIDAMARTATFRIEDWDATQDTPYRLSYECNTASGRKQFYSEGLIRKEPWDDDEIVVAAFTGNNDLGFPNNDILAQLKYHDPDLLFFSGDQIYEGVGGYGVQRSPVDKATLDYLRKWYIFGWTYGDLMRDRPAVSIPDDHDVYHGNIWGEGGKATPAGLNGYEAQDAGGYKMPPSWVNMVQRTQTSHLPDPWDPTPAEQGIGVYYCRMNYGGISFAILEDRKFKSAPRALLPRADIQNGWARNRTFDVKREADVDVAVLLGDRQLSFLHDWAVDWCDGIWMKVALSQTLFANVATLPEEEAYSDEIVPRLRILNAGEYPPNDIPVGDMDSNGWPQTGRNKALQELRRGFAFHIAGDQHLGSTVQYGIDDWHDAGFAFCVPAVSNVWPRRWYPQTPGINRKPGAPEYTGDFEDGFGNKITVHGISNPIYTGLKPSRLYDRATGYGIVRFNRKTREITIECWPRLSDPTKNEDGQYPDWPVTINQSDNYGRKAVAYLPEITVEGMDQPVVQVIDEVDNEVVYTIRILSQSYKPKVFKEGQYTIIIGEPGTANLKRLEHVQAIGVEKQASLKVVF